MTDPAAAAVRPTPRRFAGRPVGDARPEADEPAKAADRIVLVGLAIVRAGTIGLGAAETLGSSGFTHPGVVRGVLAALVVQSALTFAIALRRVRHHDPPLGTSGLGRWIAPVEAA